MVSLERTSRSSLYDKPLAYSKSVQRFSINLNGNIFAVKASDMSYQTPCLRILFAGKLLSQKQVIATKASTFEVSRSDAAFEGKAVMIPWLKWSLKWPFDLTDDQQTDIQTMYVHPNRYTVKSHSCRRSGRLNSSSNVMTIRNWRTLIVVDTYSRTHVYMIFSLSKIRHVSSEMGR